MKIKKFNESNEVESPCVGICKLDRSGVCEGCKRTTKEIKHWWDFTNEEKAKVIRRIENLPKEDSGDYYGFPW